MHVAARTEIFSRAGQDNHFHIVRLSHYAKKIAQFGVRLECQRIFSLGSVQRDGCRSMRNLKLKISR
jgi:hypothetical protein